MRGTVDTSQFRKLSRDLIDAIPEVQLATKASVRAGAEAVRSDAIARVSSWSRVDPNRARRSAGVAASIRVHMAGNTAVVTAGGSAAPEAAAIENRGRGLVRHPTFGHRDRMTSKNSKPAFMRPAMETVGIPAGKVIEDAVIGAVERKMRGR